jgi:uncharacterized alpha-E superfamily protein
MLSRIADSLFWLNRYMERSDVILRLVYVHYILSLDNTANGSSSWKPVLELCTALNPDAISAIQYDTPAVLKKLLTDESNPNSIRSITNRARENARGAQDHITKEVWEVVNQMYHQANQPSLQSRLRNDQAIKVVEAFARSTVLFTGITDNTMSRGLGWNFMLLGKFMERCLHTIAITRKHLELIQAKENAMNDILEWRHLLFSLSGYELHLKTYRTQDHSYNVLQQIMLNENFTRSILYSLVRINHYLENIMIIHEDQNKVLVRSFGRIFSKVSYMDLQAMEIPALQQFLSDLYMELLDFSSQAAQHYFSYT